MIDTASSSAASGSAPKPWWHALIIALFALALSVFFFAPRLWLMREPVAGSFQWSRATSFLLQCESPFRTDVEPAMLWRVLPPLLAHALHLPGKTPLLFPWFGVLAVTTYVAILLRRRCDDTRFVVGGTLLFASTSAVLVPVGWLGVNDAWIWFGLLAVAFGRSAWAVPLACVLCPWVDERFLIGFPLAWLTRCADRQEPLLRRPALNALWLMPYLAIRLALNRTEAATAAFLHTQVSQSLQVLPFVPLGWWMGLRAGWIAVVYAVVEKSGRAAPLLGTVLAMTLVASWLLASDLSRSVAILCPLVIAGCFAVARRHPAHAPRVVLICGVANLLIPAAHLTWVHIDPINPLPIELFRLLR